MVQTTHPAESQSDQCLAAIRSAMVDLATLAANGDSSAARILRIFDAVSRQWCLDDALCPRCDHRCVGWHNRDPGPLPF